MKSQSFHPRETADVLAHGNRLLFVLIVTVATVLLGITAISLVCAYTVPPIARGPAFDARVTVLEYYFYFDQPAKTAAYQMCCLALPFLLGGGFWAAYRWITRLTDSTINRLNLLGLILYLVLMMSCAIPIIYCPKIPFYILPPVWLLLPFTYSSPLCSPVRIVLILAVIGLQYYFLTSPASRRNAFRAMLVLLTIWVLVIPSRFYVPSEIDDDPRYLYHLNSVLDALSQSVNGHHLLVDYPHIYGGYIEILAPVIRFFHRSPGVLIAVLAVTDILGKLCQLLLAATVIRRPAVLFVCGLTILSVGCLASSQDINYSYLAPRLFLPPVGLLAATLYFRRHGLVAYVATTAVTVLASIWNLDSGLVLWLSWVGTLSISAMAARDFPALARHFLAQAAAFTLAWGGFFLYLRLASGEWPEPSLIFYFPHFIVGTGYFCLPILFPDMWIFILLLYLMSSALILAAYVRKVATWMTPVALMLTLFGIGLFSYFMGRSAPSNLLAVCYPAIVLAGMFCAKGEMLIRRRKLPTMARYFLFPSTIALFYWSFLFVAALPDEIRHSAHVIRHWNDPTQTPFRANVSFILSETRPHEDGIYFLSNHSGFYYYLSDTLRPIRIPGTIELLQARDMETLIDALQHRRFSKLFVEENFFFITMYRPDLYDRIHAAIAQNYRVEKAGPTGKLVLYTPQ